MQWVLGIQGAQLSWASQSLGLEAEYTIVNHFQLQEDLLIS